MHKKTGVRNRSKKKISEHLNKTSLFKLSTCEKIGFKKKKHIRKAGNNKGWEIIFN